MPESSENTTHNQPTVSLRGDLTIGTPLVDYAPAIEQAKESGNALTVTDEGIKTWDTTLPMYLRNLRQACEDAQVKVDLSSMPEGAMALLALADAVPERKGARRGENTDPFLERVGNKSVAIYEEGVSTLSFLGEAVISLSRFLTGRARYFKPDLWVIIERCGPQALGIVTTVSLLVGAILAFVGSIQLKMFGAEVFVANLVGISMIMEMGALMTGIILAGRTGAAFAAELGTMQVNEEIDALQTMGIPPMDYLVLPRMLALGLMTPLLVVYANLIGILGGAIVGLFVLDMSPTFFFAQTFSMITMWMCAQGLIKGSTYGVLIALAGCLRGIQCGRSASAVGDAATSAVVTSIVLIVIADALWTFIFMVIG